MYAYVLDVRTVLRVFLMLISSFARYYRRGTECHGCGIRVPVVHARPACRACMHGVHSGHANRACMQRVHAGGAQKEGHASLKSCRMVAQRVSPMVGTLSLSTPSPSTSTPCSNCPPSPPPSGAHPPFSWPPTPPPLSPGSHGSAPDT